MINRNLNKGGFASMITTYLMRKQTLSVATIDACGTRVPEFRPNPILTQIDGDFRGSKILPEVLTT